MVDASCARKFCGAQTTVYKSRHPIGVHDTRSSHKLQPNRVIFSIEWLSPDRDDPRTADGGNEHLKKKKISIENLLRL